ncbi:MAG: transcription-repair coupling factor [Oscillospiraceae bacterium]|jgi:transcription-repair coupling factor (superfamily II helicase)|nr:transcription-repair coupling factor [Oscillospiraceae bacterium]
MKALTSAILSDAVLRRVVNSPKSGGCPAVISGLSAVARAQLLASIRAEGNTTLYITSDELEARRAASDLTSLTGETVTILPARDYIFHDVEGASRDWEQLRLRTLYEITDGADIVVTTAPALMQRSVSRETFIRNVIEIVPRDSYNIDALCDALSQCGYSRAEQVEGRGQFARRGGILDFYSPAHENAIRCEFWGDDVDSLTYFDVNTQRRTENCDRALILPARDALITPQNTPKLIAALESLISATSTRGTRATTLRTRLQSDIQRLNDGRGLPSADRYMELLDGFATALDFLPRGMVVLISEPNRVRESAERYETRIAEDIVPLLESGAIEQSLNRFSLGVEDFFSALADFPVVMADSFTVSNYPLTPRTLLSTLTKQLPSYGGSLDTAAADLAHYASQGYRAVVAVSSAARGGALAEFLRDRDVAATYTESLETLPESGLCAITLGALSAGVEYPNIKLAVLTEGQIVERAAPRRRKSAKPSNRQKLMSYTDLKQGDLVVHDTHGIGRYAGLHTMTVDGAPRDYIKIAFRDGDSVYIPATQLDVVSKYIGGGENAEIRLSKLGGVDWTKTKSRARASARDMAAELTKLYAERQRARGHAFADDPIWQREFEDAFGYEETDDQLRSTDEIKRDMERPVPMDRILCGDVGFGKTEVALRAVMKCVLDGYQAAILVPTTVLCSQHYTTAMKRFAGYPVNIETLSRFRTPAETRRALQNIESGTCDLVIGTHRLLSKDIKFHKLGLLVVDEEQRFGVAHKERLKEIAKRVDVLTLSATPIPRTLNMALSGIRDMSTIEEPPTGRVPVQTYVMEHDWGVLLDAMSRELARGGQVYYLHNRIETIERVAARISDTLNPSVGGDVHIAPTVTVAVAHGRMDEESLSDVMERVSDGSVQILVCTTIIETGIDIPNVNTLIIEDADHMGLAQLHQIRGRVGRSPRRAFAYLTFKRGKVLSEVAEKRLGAIREFAEFNSGFRIAMRDLEIRGAGNLLGAEQSGHMMKVGYDMYLRLLEEAVLEERGETPKPRTVTSADLAVTAQLPAKYVPSGDQRLDLYRRIARVKTEEDADEMIAELIDRYGDPPDEALALIRIARLRADAAELGITDITQKGKLLRLKLESFDAAAITSLYAQPQFKGRIKVEAGSVAAIALRLNNDSLTDAEELIRCWQGLGN